MVCPSFGRRAGLIAATLAAFHPLHIYYAHEARAYAFWMLILTAAMCLLYEAARGNRWRWWVLYGTVLLLCLPTHYFTIYWVPASLACVLVAHDRRRALRRWLITTVAVAVLFAPYFFAAVAPAGGGGGGKWIDRSWEPVSAIPRTLWALLPAGDYPAHLRGLSLASPDTTPLAPRLDIVARSIPVVLLAVAVLLLGRRRGTRRRGADSKVALHGPVEREFLFIMSLTFGPLILAWLYSLIVRPNYFVGRYDMAAWPAFIILMSLLLANVPRVIGRASGRPTPNKAAWDISLTTCLLLVACSAVPVARFLAWRPPPSPHRTRAEKLARLAGPDDLAVTFSYDREYLLYYLRHAGFDGRIVSFPSWLDRQVGWIDTDEDLSDTDRLSRDAEQMAGFLSRSLDAGARVWWVKDSLPPSRRIEINRHLEEALRSDGFTLEPASPDWRIWKLQKPAPR